MRPSRCLNAGLPADERSWPDLKVIALNSNLASRRFSGTESVLLIKVDQQRPHGRDAHTSLMGAGAACQSGLLRFSVNEENMMLKLMLIRSLSLALASTECCR